MIFYQVCKLSCSGEEQQILPVPAYESQNDDFEENCDFEENWYYFSLWYFFFIIIF